jgi:surface protein
VKKIIFLLVFISIFGYAQTPITDANIQAAVDLWVSDSSAATTTYGIISDWDVSQVTDMSRLFYNKTTFNDEISNWNVSNVTNMGFMFFGASAFNQPINTSGDIWNTTSVTNMVGMFKGATVFNGDISSWNTAAVTSTKEMFMDANAFNGNISSWNTAAVTNMREMFLGARSFNRAIPTSGTSWNTAAVTDMSSMFKNTNVFNQDISSWNTGAVTTMSAMFMGAGTFNQEIGSWDTSKVTNMYYMFGYSSNFNGDISSWNTTTVTNMEAMFLDAAAFNQDLTGWCVSNISSEPSNFSSSSPLSDANKPVWGTCSNTLTPITSANIQTAVDLWFSDPSAATTTYGNISDWDVGSVTDMSYMFYNPPSFNQDIGSWDVSSVTNMSAMFWQATSFNQDISSWDVSSVANMVEMFNASGISTENYDKLLLGWSELTLQQGVIFESEGINFCNGAAARQSIIDTYGWTITDAGLDCATAGIEDEHLFAISIYPNPTDNTLFITGNESPIAVAIYNVLGKEVLSIKNTNNINVKALPSGVYVIRISDGVGQTNRKFIKN